MATQDPVAKSTKKSTIDRMIFWLRIVFRSLDRVSPSLAGRAAERLFFTPGKARRGLASPLLASARPVRIAVAGRRVAAWRWGRGPTVLLLHGWSGWGAQLAAFVEPLRAQGFSVVMIDAPGHGASGRQRSSAPQFASAVRAVAAVTGPLAGIVAHSLGAAGAALAMAEGAAVGRLVLLAPAADPPSWIPPFAARLGLSASSVAHLRARSEARIGCRWDDLHVPTLLASTAAPLLVIHDREDREVAWTDGVAIASAHRDAELVTTEGLGHLRLLRDPGVVATSVAFLTRGVARCAGCGDPLPARTAADAENRHCPRCRLELDLFDPARRWIATPAGPRATEVVGGGPMG